MIITKDRIFKGNLTPKLFENSHNIFTFGSNKAGIHGAGAAKMAAKIGAVFGEGKGMFGNTYAIPTKGATLKTLHTEEIKGYIDIFGMTVENCPELTFYITDIGCGLACYKEEIIAPLFKDIAKLENTRFSETFAEIINYE